MKLWKHQQDAIRLFLEKKNRLYLNWDTGTGKTIGALAIAKTYNYQNVLVVAPKSSHFSWIEDNKHFNINLSLYSYESFRSKVDDISLYDLVIFDEAHRLKNPKAQVTKKAYKLIAYTDKPRLMLSGTPADRFYEMYMQYKILDVYLFPYKSYSQFINRYYILNRFWQPERLKDPKDAEELKQIISLVTHKVKKEDVLELPPLMQRNIILPKFPLKIDIEDLGLYTVSHFIQDYKYSQGINDTGVYKTDKIDWLLDFVEDNPQTIAFSLFKAIPKYVKEKFKGKFYIITGDNKDDLERAIKYGDKPILATYALKEGANLQKYKNVVYLSLPLAFRDLEQSMSRVYRAGQKEKTIIYYILQNKVDFIVQNILKEKKDVYDYLRKES
ncbi:MAG: DEAD/DEAH box helicase family protein [Brevinematia bacterium]